MTYKTKVRLDTAFYDCYKRYGLKLGFNRGRISFAYIENELRLGYSGKTVSYVIGKYKKYIDGRNRI